MIPTVQKMLYSKQDAALALAISVRTVDNLIVSKQLKPVRIGSRVLISADELRKFCKTSHPELN